MSPSEEFEKEYAASFPFIWKLCHSFTTDVTQADDLVQETFELVWKNWATFRHESQRTTWIYRIALNVCLASTRKAPLQEKKRVRLEQAAHLPAQDEWPDQQADIQALYSAIGQLKEADRLLINLYLQELSYPEIAQITGLRENTLAVRIYRIKKQLAEWLKTYERL